MKRLATIPAAAIAGLFVLPGIAAANAYTADATCAGLTVEVPRAEDGTTVSAYLNGSLVHQEFVATFGEQVAFTIASPDQSVVQSWRVTITGWNGSAPTFTETVAACVSSSTVVPSTSPSSTSSTVPATTVVAVTTPPVVPPTTVVTPPRATTTLATEVPPTLVATGPDPRVAGAGFMGFLALTLGGAAMALARRRGV